MLLIDDAMEVKHIFALNCPEPNLQIAGPEGKSEEKIHFFHSTSRKMFYLNWMKANLNDAKAFLFFFKLAGRITEDSNSI